MKQIKSLKETNPALFQKGIEELGMDSGDKLGQAISRLAYTIKKDREKLSQDKQSTLSSPSTTSNTQLPSSSSDTSTNVNTNSNANANSDLNAVTEDLTLLDRPDSELTEEEKKEKKRLRFLMNTKIGREKAKQKREQLKAVKVFYFILKTITLNIRIKKMQI